MIPRSITSELLAQLKEFPVVTVLGPRQAGKTTLVKAACPDYQYVSLEDPSVRSKAEEDPKGFFRNYKNRVILDEIQRAPELLSYIQLIVDESNDCGQFVLTGSHQLSLREAITQSLAGRTGILHLLPFSIDELTGAGIDLPHFSDYLFTGFLPRIFDKEQRPAVAWGAYYQTYVERDVRQLIQLKDAAQFQRFVKLLAGRVGQLINYSSLGNDIGVDGKTVKHWLSILEASYIVFQLQPYFENFGKRVVKSSKVYFTDVGLLSYLLGIESADQAERDPLVGQMFENLVIVDILKQRFNHSRQPNLYFFRDSKGNEVDLIIADRTLTGIEIKSSQTYHSSFKRGLQHFSANYRELEKQAIVYSGEPHNFSDGIDLVNFSDAAAYLK